jgi:hypothetical protein
MPPYRFRLRWRLEPGRSVQGLDRPLIVNLPDSGECELKVIREPSETGGQDLALKSGGFDSADAAGAAGEKTLAGLLLTSLRQGYGVSTLARTPPGVVTKYGKAMMAGDRFDSIYDDRYGLTVFEDVGRPGFVSVGEVRPLVSGYGTQFCEIWSAATDRQHRRTSNSTTENQVTLLPDLADFLNDHCPHGSLAADTTEPAWNGYLLTLACPVCGGV